MKRVLIGCCLALGVAALTWAGQETRSFLVHYRAVHDAAAVIEPLLSSQGSITLKPGQGTLVVTDSTEVLAHISEALVGWDVPVAQYRVRISVLMARTDLPETSALPRSVDRKVWQEVNKLFPYYKAFEELGTVEVKANEGSTLESNAGPHYLLRFSLRAVPSDRRRILLQPLEIIRVGLPGGLPSPTLEKCAVSLPFGQTQVLFVSSGGGSTRALMLVLLAREEARP